MDQTWRSPNSPRWHNPRFSHQQQEQNFGSPYPQNFRSPRYRGMRGFNSPYSSPIMSQDYQPHYRHQQQHFRPRGATNQGIRPSRNNNSIENWLSPEMWEDPWSHLISKSSNREVDNVSKNDNISNCEMENLTKTTNVEETATSTANQVVNNSNINSLQSNIDSITNL